MRAGCRHRVGGESIASYPRGRFDLSIEHDFRRSGGLEIRLQGDSAGASVEGILDGLNDLLQLDHAAIEAYEVAIEQLRDRQQALQIEGFKRDHERHIQELNDLILALGGSPKNESHVSAPLAQGMQKLAATMGDRALLIAWRGNELRMMTKYDEYTRKALLWPAEAKRLIDRNALDEERHYRWVLGVLGGDEDEEDVTDRVREAMARAREMSVEAQERLSGAAFAARIRAAEGLEEAAGRLGEFAREQGGETGLVRHAADGAQRAARGFGSAAELLREGGRAPRRTLREVVEQEVRVRPARGLLAIFAVGFLLGRVLR